MPYSTLIMMLSDAPRYVTNKKDEPVRITSKEQLMGLFGGER